MVESEPPTAGLPEDQTLHLSIIFFINQLIVWSENAGKMTLTQVTE